MKAGTLKEPIEILRVQVTRNEYGEQFDMYEPVYRTRADVKAISGGRTDQNNEIFYEHTKQFIVRRYVPVDEFDRIMYKCKQYRIINIDDDIYFNQKIIIAELVNQ